MKYGHIPFQFEARILDLQICVLHCHPDKPACLLIHGLYAAPRSDLY